MYEEDGYLGKIDGQHVQVMVPIGNIISPDFHQENIGSVFRKEDLMVVDEDCNIEMLLFQNQQRRKKAKKKRIQRQKKKQLPTKQQHEKKKEEYLVIYDIMGQISLKSHYLHDLEKEKKKFLR